MRYSAVREVEELAQGDTRQAPAAPAPGRLSDQPCADCLDHSASPGRRRLAAPRQAAFSPDLTNGCKLASGSSAEKPQPQWLFAEETIRRNPAPVRIISPSGA